MITTTKNQARQRFGTLPPRLQDAMFSPQTVEIINLIAGQNNLSNEKAGKIADIAGWVLLGFLHIEDVTRELQEALGIPQPAAALIAQSLENKLLNPLRDDIEKTYAPALHKEELGGPKIIQDIEMAPRATSQTTLPPPAPTPIKSKLSDAGWSRTTVEQPVVRLSQTPPSPPSVPKPATPPAAPPMPANAPVGEFERLAMRGGTPPKPQPQAAAPTAPAAPVTPAAPAMPAVPTAPKPAELAPIIIHEDTVFRPQQRSPDFRLTPLTERFDMQKAAGPPTIKAAVLELGKAPATPAPKPPISTPRVVHYTEYQPTAKVTAPPPPPPKIEKRE